MNYGQLLSCAWNIIWDNKFLILLGVLVALGSGGNSGLSTGSSFNSGGLETGFEAPTPPPEMPEMPEMPEFQQPGRGFRIPLRTLFSGVPVALALLLGGLALTVGVAIWVVSTIARGGLIAGASEIDAGGISSFSQAWRAGWQRVWRLLGISILPALPVLAMGVIGLVLFLTSAGVSTALGEQVGLPVMGNLVAVLGLIGCLVVPITLVLGLLSAFANRACMLEDLGVFDAYRRGLSVLTENFGSALVLFLIQIGIGLAMGIAMILPGVLSLLCCVLWPLLLLVQGGIEAYFSTLWTLAWRKWTGEGTYTAEPITV
jgi:hypothetical protein